MDVRIGDIRFIGRVPAGTMLLTYGARCFLVHPDHPIREVVVDPRTGDGHLVDRVDLTLAVEPDGGTFRLEPTEELPRPAGQ